MKQGNRHDYAVTPFEIHQNSLKTRQGVALDANSLSELKIGPGLGAVPGSHNRLNGGNLAVVYRKWNPAATDDCDDARGDQNRQALQGVKATKHVTRKQWSVNLSEASVPTLLRLIRRKQGLVALARQQHGCGALPTGPDLKREPSLSVGFEGHRESVTPSDVVTFLCTRLGYRHKPSPPLQCLVASSLPDCRF